MATKAITPLTLSVLGLYFSETADMMTYLSERLDPMDSDYNGSVSEYLLRDMDAPAYRNLVSTSYVASKTSTVDNGGKQVFKAYPPMVYMREVHPLNLYARCTKRLLSFPKLIDRAQWMLLTKAKGRSSNIITSGYRMVRGPTLFVTPVRLSQS